MGFVHRHRVRYVECDMQGVVHNSHYLAIVDDAIDQWFAPLTEPNVVAGWDFMVKRAEIVWSSPARVREEIRTTLDVSRWGTTSFDVRAGGEVDGRAVFTCTITYVGVDRGSLRPMAVPVHVREFVG